MSAPTLKPAKGATINRVTGWKVQNVEPCRGTKENPLEMTPIQRYIYDYIVAFMREHGFSPTILEITLDCGFNTRQTVHTHVKKIASKGVIQLVKGTQRMIRVPGVKCDEFYAATPRELMQALRLKASKEAGPEGLDDYPTCPECGKIHVLHNVTGIDAVEMTCDGCGHVFKCEMMVFYSTWKEKDDRNNGRTDTGGEAGTDRLKGFHLKEDDGDHEGCRIHSQVWTQ